MNASQQQCQPGENGVSALTTAEIEAVLAKLPLWQINPEGTQIQRHFHFKNFLTTMAFVNAVAWIAHQQGHHPDLEIGYNHCTVKYSTHAIHGLSDKDFMGAGKIDALEQPTS